MNIKKYYDKTILLVSILFLFIHILSYTSDTIIMGATNWEPFTGEKLEFGGFLSEITKEAMSRSGYIIQIAFLPWSRALLMIKTGEIDGLMGVYYTAERLNFVAFTDSLGKTDVVFLKLKNNAAPRHYYSLHELENCTIGNPRGFSVNPDFDQADFLNKEEANSSYLNLKKLLAGRIDIIVDSRETLFYLLETHFKENKNDVEVISPIVDTKEIYITFSRINPEYRKLITAFNNGLQEIRNDGTYEMIEKKHKLNIIN